jgi:hypothetical protein
MNRKLIVNELCAWPDIPESDSRKILDSIATTIRKHPGLKRQRTLPKRIRDKLKLQKSADDNEQKQQQQNQKNDQIKPSPLKQHILLGINSITKCLERTPHRLLFVLVCRSCKPLVVLTRHLQVMCAHHNVPAGCVANLSSILGKLLNMKTVSAFAFCTKPLTEIESSSVDNDKLNAAVDEFKRSVVSRLAPLTNPFTACVSGQIKEIAVEIEIDAVKSQVAEADQEVSLDKNSSWMECDDDDDDNDDKEVEHFGSDFISFGGKSDERELAFDSVDFVAFKDGYVRLQQDVVSVQMGSFDNGRFNQLSMIQQRSRKKNKPDLKGKKMKALASNKFNSGQKKQKKNSIQNKNTNNKVNK